jgi:hypothetical protein
MKKNNGNTSNLAQVTTSAGHSTMLNLMLPNLCQRNIKDAKEKGKSVDHPTVSSAKQGWDLK